jgi:Bacterial Ig-like domain (group 3)
MRRREPLCTESFGISVRAAARISEWARRAALTAMPCQNDPSSHEAGVSSASHSLPGCGMTGQMFPDCGPNASVEREKTVLKDMQTSNLRILLMAGLVMATAFGLAPAGAAAQSGSSPFTSIDVTGAGTGAHQGTAATAIDAAGDVTGVYFDGSGNEHAFVLPAGGAITSFDASGTGGEGIETIPIGFDTTGDIAGIYHDASNRVHGFVRAASAGTITLLDVPGEDTGKGEGTFPVCINGAGEIAGDYSTTITTSSGSNSFAHGFVRDASGTITTFDAVPLPTSYGSTNPGTYVISINASGEVAGFYIDGVGAEHGFLRDASGTISTFEAPNAGSGPAQGTLVTGIDAAGDVIGVYADATNAIHGFVRSASTDTITPIDAPGEGSATYQGTYPDAFDAAGDISGSFTDENNVVHGFILPAGGTITTYDAPGAAASDALRRAASVRLNSKLRQLGKSYGLSLKPRRSNNPFMKLRSLLGSVGAVKTEGTGLLNGSGPNPSGTASFGDFVFNSVNASGEIAGIYTDGNYVFHGYLRATSGSITSIDDPNAGTSEEQGTGSLAINASGMIAGTYVDSSSVLHGFLYDSSALTATTTTLTPVPTPDPSVYQEPVTLTASVSSSGGTPPNGENVTFMSGTTSLGTAELTSGTASLTTTALPAGTDSITAVYGGDSDFAGSTSAAVSQTVSKASSSLTLTSSPNPSTFGQSVTLTANVSGQFSGVATGTVTFSNGSSSLGSVSVSSNLATLATTDLPVGTDSITAAYSGDSNFTGSTSSTLSQVVNAAPGFGPPSGYSPGSISIEPGATTGDTATISIVGTYGFSGTVSLACSISPVAAKDPPTCTLSPSSVTLSGTTVETSTLTVSTTAASSRAVRPLWRPVGGTALAVILMLAIPRRRRSWFAALVLLAMVAAIGVSGCGGSGSNSNGNSGTTAGAYTVTVTGTSGSTTATITTVSLTVE